MDIKKGKFRLLILTKLFLLRIGKYTLYFPSSFFMGYNRVNYPYAINFRNWSFCYLTLERKDR